MTIQDLQKKVLKDGNTFSQKLTVWGSEYIVINSVKFRLSDHKGKEHSSAIDVNSYEEIIYYLKNENKYYEIEMTNEEFVNIYLNGGTYKSLAITQKGEYFHNGFGLFQDLKCAANNLFYKTFKS